MSTAILAKRCIHSYLRFQKRIYRSQCASCSIQSLLREASVQRWAVDNNRRHFNRGVDQRPCSSNRRYSSSKNNVRTNEINDTSKESRSSSNTVDIWFRLYVDDLPVATNAVKLQIPISNSADQADKTRPQHITMKDLQAAVKHARAADLAGFNTKWLEIYPSANASPTKPASASNQSTATAHTIGAYPLACEMAYNPLLHGGATPRAPLMVHAPKTAPLRNRPALPAKPISVWIQLYLDGSPLGPPIEVPVPIVARGRHAVEMGNDSDNATNASSSRISIGNIRHAVKAECGSVLTGVSLSMLQVFDSSWTEVAPTMQLNESTTWQAAIHGGATEEHPMIVYALPQPPLRKTAPEIDPADEQRQIQASSYAKRNAVGPMELRLPIFAQFLDYVGRPDVTVEPFTLEHVTTLVNWALKEGSLQQRADTAKLCLEAILDESLQSVNLTPDSDNPNDMATATATSTATGAAGSTRPVLYRDSDMILYLEVADDIYPLNNEPALDDAYYEAKWSDEEGCYLCPYASFTIVLTPSFLGVYGAIANSDWVCQQWLTPLHPLSEQGLAHGVKTTAEAPVNQDIVQILIALRQSIKELRQAVSSPLLLPDLPSIGDVVDLEEHLTLDYPLVRGSFVFRGKYGKHDVVTKICRSYCIEAHQLLAKEKMAPKIFWYGELAGGQWKVVVMKYHDGRVRRKLKDWQIAACECVLARLHELGFVHGDARSQNFVWTPSQKPLLIDFDHSGRIGETYYPPTTLSVDAGSEQLYCSVDRAVEPDHDFETLSTRR